MRRFLKRFLIIFILIFILVSSFASVGTQAITYKCDVKTYSDSIYMVNLDSGMAVYEKNIDKKHFPANLVKIMDFVIAVEHFDDYDTTIEVKQKLLNKLEKDDYQLSGLSDRGGDKMSVKDLLYDLMLPTGHDAAAVFADYIGEGKINNFVDMMNKKAEELGMKNTKYTSPFGDDDSKQYTTCEDMYILTKYAMNLPLFSKIVGTASYTLTGDEDPIVNSNVMLDPIRGGDYYYTYCTGVQTGVTMQAGRCLVSTASCEGYTYMIIAMKSPYDPISGDTEEYCMEEAANLYRWAFLDLKFVNLATTETPICEQKVDHAWDKDSILLVPQNDINIVLPADYAEADINFAPDKEGTISPPLSKGDFVTTATLKYKGEELFKVNLVSNDDVQLSPILYITDVIKSVLTSIWFLLSVAIVIILFVIYVFVSSSYNKKRKRTKR